jgi:hypothetical protein
MVRCAVSSDLFQTCVFDAGFSFLDREDTVRVDVVNAFLSLIQQTDHTLGDLRRKRDFADQQDPRAG